MSLHPGLNTTKIYRLPDPYSSGYTIKSPIYGTDFNTRDYNSTQLILSDLEAVIQMTLSDSFKINPSDYKVPLRNHCH